MSDEFDSDLRELQGELTTSRAELLGVIPSPKDSDLDRARRGGWTIARVLEHIIQSEINVHSRDRRHRWWSGILPARGRTS